MLPLVVRGSYCPRGSIKTGVMSDGHPVYSKAPVSTVYIQGIAITDGPANWVMDIGKIGEMDGYSGLTPGAPLYASAGVIGGIDTTAVATAPQQMRAETTTRSGKSMYWVSR